MCQILAIEGSYNILYLKDDCWRGEHLFSLKTHLHYNLLITLLFGSKAETMLVKQQCYIQIKIYRIYRKMTYGHYVSPPKGRGTYCFWCGSYLRRHSLFEALYLLNLWMDSDQTCIVTSLGWGKQSLVMMAMTSFSRAHAPKNQSILSQKWLVCTISQKNQLILVKLNTINHYYIPRIWLYFGDLDLIFKGTGLQNSQFWAKNGLSALFLMNESINFGQT